MRTSRLVLVLAILPAISSGAATELEERQSITTATEQALLRQDFAALEDSSRRYRLERSRTSSGLWKLTLYAGINVAIGNSVRAKAREPAFFELEMLTTRWAQAYPDSPAARISQAMVLISHGWAYRGGDYAGSVKPESWAPFYAHLGKARELLERHRAIASQDPKWYETMLIIARAENWERQRFAGLLNEALDREPLFYQTYFAALEYLLPKWHGDTLSIETFAQDAVRRTAKSEGRGMYARIYWFASQTQYRNDLFSGSLANWPRMKEGFEDVVARYPDAWNLNNYARFACLARDKPKARELLARIEEIPDAWPTPRMRAECQAWAGS